MGTTTKGVRGRGAATNPATRFGLTELVPEEAPPDRVETVVLADSSRTIIARNSSPDIPFDASINPYRGCEHGCVYCYARTFHEYLDLSARLDFETRILVKHDAAARRHGIDQEPAPLATRHFRRPSGVQMDLW